MTTEDKKISSIYQQANSVEPPSHIDETILAASRDAVTSNTRTRSPFAGGWPLSMVAVVIVAVIVVPVVVQESSQPEETSVASSNTPTPMPAKPEAVAAKENRQGKAKPRLPAAPASKSDKSAHTMPATLQLEESANKTMMSQQLMQQSAAASPAASAYDLVPEEQDLLSNETAAGGLMKQSSADKDIDKEKIVERKKVALRALAGSPRPADEWLVTINKLIAANKLEQARIEWKAFKQSYPDHPDNKKLKKLLSNHE